MQLLDQHGRPVNAEINEQQNRVLIPGAVADTLAQERIDAEIKRGSHEFDKLTEHLIQAARDGEKRMKDQNLPRRPDAPEVAEVEAIIRMLGETVKAIYAEGGAPIVIATALRFYGESIIQFLVAPAMAKQAKIDAATTPTDVVMPLAANDSEK